MLLTKDSLQLKGHIYLKIKEEKKILHTNGNQNRVGVAVLIPDKIDIKSKTLKRGREDHSMIMETNH